MFHHPLTDTDRESLEASGIGPHILTAVSARTTPDGVTFTLPDLTRPDEPFDQVMLSAARRAEISAALRAEGKPDRPPKYIGPKGRGGALWCPVPRPTASTVLFVEGTKGHLAAVSWASEDIEVIGINGCWGWSVGDGLARPHPAISRVAGRRVIVALDADVRTNPDVNQAGHALQVHLEAARAGSVAFADFGVGTDGLDDVLAGLHDGVERQAFLDKMVADAQPLKVMTSAERARISAGLETRRAQHDLAEASETSGMAPLPAVDKDVAAAFARANADILRYDAVAGKWVTWTGQLWNRSAGNTLAQAQFQRFVDEGPPVYEDKTVGGIAIPVRATKWMGEYRRVAAVLGHAQSMAPLVVTQPDIWDANPYLFALRNGTLELASLEFRESRPADMQISMAGTAYDPDAVAPVWTGFIEWAIPDPDVRAFLQRILGYSLLGQVRHHILPCLVGTGGNGKGTVIRIMSALFGDYAGQANARLIVAGRDPHDTDASTVYGKRVAFFEETAAGTRWDVNSLKNLTGGDSGTVRELYGEPRKVAPQHTLILGTNHRPNIPPGERAFWRRYREIPFNETVADGKARPLDIQIIDTELPGVLNWVLEGLASYWAALAAGFDPMAAPDAVMAASAEARTEGSEFSQWFLDRYIVTGSDEDQMKVGDLWERWDAFRRTQTLPNAHPRGARYLADAVIGDADGRVRKEKDRKNASWLIGIRQNPGSAGGPEHHGTVTANRSMPSQQGMHSDLGYAPKTPGQPTSEYPEYPEYPSSESSVSIDEVGGKIGSENEALIGREWKSGSAASAGSAPPPLTSENGVHTQESADFPASAGYSVPGSSDSSRLMDIVVAGAVALDTEGCSIADRWAVPIQNYTRLSGLGSPSGYGFTPDVADVAGAIAQAPMVVGQNIARFDMVNLELAAQVLGTPGPDTLEMAREGRILDTMVADQLINPPPAHMKPERAMALYSLTESAARWGVEGKTDDLPRLAEKHGGYDRIPLDDREYQDYLRGDVASHGALARAMAGSGKITPYVMREMRVAAVAGHITAAGIEVDQPLLAERRKQTRADKVAMIGMLKDQYGVEGRTKGGKPSLSPQSTDEGKLAIVDAFGRLGVHPNDIPRTGEGAPSVGKDGMGELAIMYRHNPAIVRLCALVAGISGSRTVYETTAKNLHADGAVHPEVLTLQASGRWSVIKPGMTVFGKRGGRVVERAVFSSREGTSFVAADLSQIDMRGVAGHAQDWAFIQLFMPGRDAHTETARMVFGDPDRREDAKPCNHGWQYGLGADGAVKSGIDRDLFVQFDMGMQRTFPGLCAWREGVRNHVRAGGKLDNGFGRIMHPDIDRAHTQGPALMGQGTARDLMMKVILDLPNDVAKMIRIQVHDEIVLEVADSDVPEITNLLMKTMAFEWAPPNASIPVPIIGEVSKPGKNWAACYDK